MFPLFVLLQNHGPWFDWDWFTRYETKFDKEGYVDIGLKSLNSAKVVPEDQATELCLAIEIIDYQKPGNNGFIFLKPKTGSIFPNAKFETKYFNRGEGRSARTFAMREMTWEIMEKTGFGSLKDGKYDIEYSEMNTFGVNKKDILVILVRIYSDFWSKELALPENTVFVPWNKAESYLTVVKRSKIPSEQKKLFKVLSNCI